MSLQGSISAPSTERIVLSAEERTSLRQQKFEQHQIIELPGLEGAILPTISFARLEIIPELSGGFREEILRMLGGYISALPDPEGIEKAHEDQKHLLVGNRAIVVPSRFNGNRYHVGESFISDCDEVQIALPHSPSDVFHTWFKVVRQKAEIVERKPRYRQVGITPRRPIKPYRETLIFVRTHFAALIQAIEKPILTSKKQRSRELEALTTADSPMFLRFKRFKQDNTPAHQEKNGPTKSELRDRLNQYKQENEELRHLLYRVLLALTTS